VSQYSDICYQCSVVNNVYYLSSIICDDDLVTILFEVVYLWGTKYIDDSYTEWLHECLGDVSIIIQQSLQSLS